MIGVLALAGVLFAAALMLSDRAPGMLSDLFGDDVRRLWERVDASGRADFVTDGERPETDTVIHIAIWAIVTGLVALAVWSWRGLLATIAAVFACSVVVELGQGRWSSTRSVESDDITANLAGTLIGGAVAAIAYLAWSAISARFDDWRRRDDRVR